MAQTAKQAESVASLFASKAAPADAKLSGLFSTENKAKFARLVKQPELQAPKVKRVKIAVPQAETVVGSEVATAAGKKRKLPNSAEGAQAAAAASAASGDEDATPKRVKKPKWKKRNAEETKAQESSEQAAATRADNEAADGKDEATTTAEEDEAAAADGAEERTLFVGNVSLNTKLKTLRAMFAQFGEIASMRMRSVPTEGVAVDQSGNQALVKKVSVNKQLFGEQKGSYNAYIVYKNAESITAALSMNNHVLDGRHLRVDRSNPSQFPPKRTVFLGQLPHIIDEEQLREHFAAVLPNGQDDIESVRLIRDRETLEGKGIGYLWLKDEACVVQALTLDGSTFGKRPIRVTTCGKRTKRTAMTPEEKREQELAFRAEKHMGAISGAAKRIRAKAVKNPNPGKKGGKAGKRSKPGKAGKPKGKGKPKAQKS